MSRPGLRIIIGLTAFLTASLLYAQNPVVSGFVTDSLSHEPLIGAVVYTGNHGVQVNSYGYYSIPLPRGENSLSFAIQGYRTKTISLNIEHDTVINVGLQQEDIKLSESRVLASSQTGFHAISMGAMDLPVSVIRNAPSLMGEPDVLKTAQLLPGFDSGLDGTAGLFVRGGNQEENLYLLDGVPLYNVSHLLGLFSAFSPDAVKSVTLYKGSFPARFGGRVSSVIDVWTNEGNRSAINGSVGIGTLNDKVHLEIPLFDGRTTVSLTGRAIHTFFLEPILKAIDSQLRYFFYDFNGKITHRLGDRDYLSFTTYHGIDSFDFTSDKTKTRSEDDLLIQNSSTHLLWGNTMGSLRWNHVLRNSLFSSVSVNYNQYRSISDYSNKTEAMKAQTILEKWASSSSGIKDYSASWQLDWTQSKFASLKAGFTGTYHEFSPETDFKTELQAEQLSHFSAKESQTGIETALWAESEFSILRFLNMNTGLRLTFMSSGAKTYSYLEPRVSAKLDLNRFWALKAAYSRMSQFVHLLSNSDLSSPMDLWVPITEDIKPVVSDQAGIGAYYDSGTGWNISLETYYKWMQNVLEYRDGVSFSGADNDWMSMVEMGLGRCYGAELLIQRTKGTLTGWLAYSLSRSERCFPDGNVNNGKWFPSKYDRIHNLLLFMNASLTKNINLSLTWSLTGGTRFTHADRNYLQTNILIDPEGDSRAAYISSKNNYRMPPSHSLDVSLNLRHKHKRHGISMWGFGINNIYNSMNPNLVWESGDQHEDNQFRMIKTTYLTFLPSVNYTYKF